MEKNTNGENLNGENLKVEKNNIWKIDQSQNVVIQMCLRVLMKFTRIVEADIDDKQFDGYSVRYICKKNFVAADETVRSCRD